MSGIRPAMLSRMNNSSQRSWRRYQRRSLAMLPPHLGCHAAHLCRVLQQRVVAMPLHEVGAAHEGAVLGRAPVVMPQIEIREVNRRGEWLARQHAVLAQSLDDLPG